MKLKNMRAGELLALAGAICVVVSLFVRSYEAPSGTLDAWETFGFGVVLLLIAVCAALAVVLTALTERSAALPVASGVWCVLFGFIAVIAALVRALVLPDQATSTCFGVWLALGGAVLILAGAWQVIRDERTSLYPPARPERKKVEPPSGS